MSQRKIVGIALLGMGVAVAMQTAPAFTNDESLSEQYWCGYPQYQLTQNEKVFRPAEGRANFTHFLGVTNLAVKDGKLVFTLDADKAILGWGNYMGDQPLSNIVDMFHTKNVVKVKVQSTLPDKSTWNLRFWVNGGRMQGGDAAVAEAALEGLEPRELVFDKGYQYPVPDGFELEITGKKGAAITLDAVRLIQPYYGGFIRKDYFLPTGQVWRAIADIGGRPSLTEPFFMYINGKKVQWQSSREYYQFAAVDIAAYLKPGWNCVGIYAFRSECPHFATMQAKIIMASGEIFTWQTDNAWKYCEKPDDGWNEPGFDDFFWAPLKCGGLPAAYMQYRSRDGFIDLAGYKGLLVIRNPLKKDLVYTEEQEAALEIHLPPGLKQNGLKLKYQLGQADAEGESRVIREDGSAQFTEKNGSLVWPLTFGRQKPGVYTVALKLEDQAGKVLAVRPREPFLVLRKLNPKPIASAADYWDSLDVELEDQIDFTDPKDPHPWVEGRVKSWSQPLEEIKEPVIVKTNGLVYREVSGNLANSYFGYRLEFKHPGSFYVVELEYPDNGNRFIYATIYSVKLGYSQSGVGVTTGDHYYRTGRMQKQRWIHVADSGPQGIFILNPTSEQPPAAKGVRVYRVKGDLPAAPAGTNRLYGIHTERCYFGSGLGNNFGCDQPHPIAPKELEAFMQTNSLMRRFIRDLSWMSATCDRYAQYLKFSGQNMHIMGCVQYGLANSPYVRPYQTDTARVPDCLRSILANTLDVNGIEFWAGVELCNIESSFPYNKAQIARGAPIVNRINDQGVSASVPGSIIPGNWMHPAYREVVRSVADDLARKFSDLPRFRGIHSVIGPAEWLPDVTGGQVKWDQAFATSYDDLTFKLFEQYLGAPLPIDPRDPQRFVKRVELLQNQAMREKYRDFRCRQFKALYADEILAALKTRRGDLQHMILFIESYGHFQKYRLDHGRAPLDFYKDFGLDLDLYRNDPNFWMGRWTYSSPCGSPQDPAYWIGRTDPAAAAAFNTEGNRYAFTESRWKENAIWLPGYTFAKSPEGAKDGWLPGKAAARGCPLPAGYHVREALVQALVLGEVNVLGSGFTDLNINVGEEDKLRSLAQVFTRLPREKFAPVLNTDLTANLAIRQLVQKGESWFYVANPGYWAITGEIVLETKGTVYDSASGDKVKTRSRDGKRVLAVALEPYGLAGYHVDADDLKIAGYTTGAIAESELAFMQGIVQEVTRYLKAEEIKLVLPLEDRAYMQGVLDAVTKDLAAQQYARAWSRLLQEKFWSYWKGFLKKAAQAAIKLPAAVVQEPANNRNGALPVLAARSTNGPLIPDGRLDKPAWQSVKFSTGFIDSDGRPLLADIGVKALYDDQNLYLAFICADKDPLALKADAESEAEVFQDDAIAIFIQPDESLPVYYQLAFNPRGVRFDQKVTGGDRDYAYAPDWQAVVRPGEKCWTAEVRLPYKAFGLEGRGGKPWRVNFHRRIRYDLAKNGSWSDDAGNWHKTDRFGRLEFN